MRGKPSGGGADDRTVMDHPRGCGENWILAPVAACMIGSPPRMRGKRGGTLAHIWGSGITPADAGKTLEFLDSRIDI